MKKHTGSLLICICALVLALPAAAQDDAMDIALDHIRQLPNKSAMVGDDFADMKVQDRYTSKHNGITHIYFKQQLGGIEVANGHLAINVHAGRVIHMKNSFVAELRTKAGAATPDLSAEEAIRAAADNLGYKVTGLLIPLKAAGGPARETIFSGAGLSREQIPAKLVYYRLEDGSARLAWNMVIHTVDQKHVYNLFVDAETGEELGKDEWLHSDSYEVFALPKESPSDGGQTIEANPADGTASPFGWHDTDGSAGAEFTTTRGNNVCAQQDRDGNDTACGGVAQPSGGGSLDFTATLDLATQQPSQYQDAAVINLFYWNNIMHDLLYQYGFDEASGNFQENNYGKGGLGSDFVNADVQDNADGNPPDTNNANMLTFPEPNGPFTTNPRMQMYEWTPPNVNLLDVDAPSSAQGTYDTTGADFGPALTSTGISGGIVLATPNDGCSALTNGGAISGNIALMDRGACSFVTKVRNAQNAGATAAIIANNRPNSPIGLGDDDTGGDITISSGMVSQADGVAINAGLPATGTARQNLNPPPNRDSDLDAGIIAHEYCHGLSTRLTGGPGTNCLGGNQQAGEGWSDLCTLFFTADAGDTATTSRSVGTYSSFEPTTGYGIRPFPYTTDMGVNPLTYGELALGTLSVPHGVGSVWATAVWEMYWNLVNDQGFDPDLYNGTGANNVAIQLVLDGLKLQGCDPTFLDARDAILAADAANNGGANECLIWSAFAKRGMGASADDGGSSSSLAVTENFDLPAQCVTGCGNGICEADESCDGNTPGTTACPADCISGTSSGAVCGNGVCEAGNGEDCVSCAADCDGKQNGKPSGRFCCGDGDGDGAIVCDASTPQCNGGGFSCTDIPVSGGSYCCGDSVCEGDETCGNCAIDCNLGAEVCTGGVDEDCDGAVDCADGECSGDPACQGGQCADPGESCRDDIDCCLGNCSGGKPSTRVCL